MAQTKFNKKHKAVLDDLLLALPDVRSGVVFGLPCYKVSTVVFATLCEEGVGIKLPAARVIELKERPEFVPFQPFGRNRGKEFVQINHKKSEDYQHDLPLFEESIRYVLSALSDKKKDSAKAPQQDSDDENRRFRSIVEMLTIENSAVAMGKMMSSPGIQYQGKVFAFYHDKKMIFKLGRDFQPELFGVRQYSHLTPFKTKPPMVDWFEIPSSEQDLWEELARHALQRMLAD